MIDIYWIGVFVLLLLMLVCVVGLIRVMARIIMELLKGAIYIIGVIVIGYVLLWLFAGGI
jgi:hypothetical protein